MSPVSSYTVSPFRAISIPFPLPVESSVLHRRTLVQPRGFSYMILSPPSMGSMWTFSTSERIMMGPMWAPSLERTPQRLEYTE